MYKVYIYPFFLKRLYIPQMRGSDIGATILIILIVIILITLNVLYVMKSQIEKNWVKYRCNPLVIPFAGLFGKNAMQNFTFCIQTIQQNYMSFVLGPTHFNLQTLNKSGSNMAQTTNNMVSFISSLRGMFTDVTGGIFGVFMNIIVEFQRLIIGLKDLGGKMMGLMATLLYLIEGSIYTAQSTWSGPIGTAVRDVGKAACFSANTLIKLKNGKHKYFKDVVLGDILSDGSEVRGVMTLKNWHKKTSNEEWFYAFNNKETNEQILVTGLHLVKYKNQFIYVKDHPEAIRTDYKERVLYCIITDTHHIPIGKYIFWDWEDTPEMNVNAAFFKLSNEDFTQDCKIKIQKKQKNGLDGKLPSLVNLS